MAPKWYWRIFNLAINLNAVRHTSACGNYYWKFDNFLSSHCFRVGKQIIASDPAPQDINLNTDLYVLWGIRANDSMAGQLLTHRPEGNPAASLELVNPAGVVAPTTPPTTPPPTPTEVPNITTPVSLILTWQPVQN